MPDAFYVAESDDRFASTELTRGPWDPDSQHAGPPAALLGRAIERLDGGAERRVGRITLEILRPVPIEPLTVSAHVVRPGRNVDLVEAVLSTDAAEVMRARAWRLSTAALDVPAEATPDPTPPPGPETAANQPFFSNARGLGYHTAMDDRFVTGAFREIGPATVWMRMRQPLVAGEDPSPLTRVLVAADSGNGVSGALNPATHVFVNTELTVHLFRLPVGEWVCLDAVTWPGTEGIGLADTALYDEQGRIGRAAQTLFVRAR